MKNIIFSFFIPIVIAVLSGMGLGGGGLFVVYLNIFSDLSQIYMQAINLVFFIFAAGASLLIHLTRRKIYFKAVLLMGVFGIAGSLIGSAVALSVDGEVLGKIFGVMLTGAGIYSFFKSKKCKKIESEQDSTDIA